MYCTTLTRSAKVAPAAASVMFAGAQDRATAGPLVGVSQVTASSPSFGPGQALIINVVATDDDGTLTIRSSLPGSKLTVNNCSGIGAQVAGQCDGAMSAV